jgi:hypothetical protein
MWLSLTLGYSLSGFYLRIKGKAWSRPSGLQIPGSMAPACYIGGGKLTERGS